MVGLTGVIGGTLSSKGSNALSAMIGVRPSSNAFPEPEEQGSHLQAICDEFINPPMSSRPGAFWCWLNGDVTKQSITNDLLEMKDKGMARAEIWDVALRDDPIGEYGVGPEFLGDQSVEMIQHALSEGKRLGMRMGLIASSGWNAGGSWVTPDWAAKALYFSELDVSGPQPFSDALPFPEVPAQCPKDQSGKPFYAKEVAVLAIPNHADKRINQHSDIRILNRNFDGRTLNWDVPEGDWVLLRFVCSNTGQHLIVPSPNSDGLFIDFFDPKATRRHLTHILERLGITKENAGDSGLNYLEFDSMELDEATPWTDEMGQIFHDHHGYGIEPHLAAFAGWELPDGNDGFLYQFKKTVSDQLIHSHYTTGKELLAEYGMDLVAEAGGPGPPIWDSCPVDSLKALGNVSIPRGEFWVQNRHHIFLVKEIASASHIYGLGEVDAESFTTWRRWKDAPHALKRHVDRAFCEGLNSVTFHTFANTRPEHGLPGRAYHAGIDVNQTATWWQQAKPFMDYLSRCSYLLKQGQFVADVAYYYGDQAPNFFPEYQRDPDSPSLDGLGAGYDFDVVNTDVVISRMDVAEGRVVLPDGMNYQLLVLPNREDIPLHVVAKVEELVAAGAKVLVQNPDIAQSINGSVLKNMSIDGALDRLSIAPDLTHDKDKLDFIHRRNGRADFYFITNKTDQPISEVCVFRVSAGQPEFWDPVTARQFQIPDARSVGGRTEITLHLAPYESRFIVFGDEARELPNRQRSGRGESSEIEGPWVLSFPENWGAPPSVEIENLISWTDHSEEGIKHFSGTASYTNSFHVPAEVLQNGRITIDLGDVLDVAEVIVNDEPVGTVWTKPFRLDVHKHVREGRNRLEIRVTNMWINRLTGDLILPPEDRFCKTNRPPVSPYYSEIGDETYRVQRAGLLGPVTLET